MSAALENISVSNRFLLKLMGRNTGVERQSKAEEVNERRKVGGTDRLGPGTDRLGTLMWHFPGFDISSEQVQACTSVRTRAQFWPHKGFCIVLTAENEHCD